MQYWLLKTEPDGFSWDQLVDAGIAGEVWDGIRNHQAAAYLRQMHAGDRAFIYHTGNERRIVGIAEITRGAHPDPSDTSGRFVAVVVRALEALAQPVSLADIRAEPELAELKLLRQSRLSVTPVSAAEWRTLSKLAKARPRS